MIFLSILMDEWNECNNCTPAAIEDFPGDLFTRQQRQAGAVAFHITISLYLFLALAVVCDKYFVPAVERISQALNMSSDICGATFMAAATSSPELFVNVIGTFITEGDIGIGTIVGSAVFNILAVAACCGIGAGMDIPLDWWPLTRDCLAYGFTVAVLICIIHDERVEWYEALILVILYIVYIGIMYFDKTIQKWARGGLRQAQSRCSQRGSLASKSSRDGDRPLSVDHFNQNGNIKSISHIDADVNAENENDDNVQKAIQSVAETVNEKASLGKSDIELVVRESKPNEKKDTIDVKKKSNEDSRFYLFRFPMHKRIWQQFFWIIIWPMEALFFFTIPNCEHKRFRNLFPLTFLMCIVWIGSLSYLVAWMITIVGDTLNIPDSVMGITFLAAGTSVPEAVSSVIVAKQGHGSMGISNSIGSNTFDILLCLGLPWLIKASFLPISEDKHWVGINSHGLEYSAISLLSTLLLLYIAFSLNKFKLDRKLGNTCLLMYAVFLILATLIELNVFFRVNLPACIHTKQ
ncbi:sodium/potassium/calcium exchanger 3 isoform X2 [Sitodiplosis mosellana]|uniref:sodium/potassium/calcium exchanger 3 isoform X2 n=1 Tax=Sitodiplosis mosellana TaxID=263140 RepID=UPI002443E815|nr:sodium/potassium/calcium exchanger 3 isoform X2 [Sitodiplosis mosellana]